MPAVAYSQHLAAQRALTPAEPSLAEMRDEFARMFRMPVAEDVEVEPADGGGEWLRTPGANREQVLVYVHGGGFFAGDPEVYRALASELGRAAGCVVRSVGYRLAPEAPYPAAVQDVDAALGAVLDSAAPGRVALAGDSAGANLALCAMLRRRDAGGSLPAVAHLMSPWVDLGLGGDSMDAKEEADVLLNRDVLAGLAGLYAAGCDPCAPGVSPLFADLAGLPPLRIQAGSSEVLLDDSVRLAGAAGAAEVDVELTIAPGLPHVFPVYAPMLPEGRAAIEAAGAGIARALASR